MIAVERFAADPARIASVAADLKSLDQAWTTLAEEFASLWAKVRRQQDAGLSAEQDVAQLTAVGTAMEMVERTAIETLTKGISLLEEVGNG